jgi:hypothetical protein
MRKTLGKLAETSESTAFTHSGARVDLRSPRVPSILAADIAEHLAKHPMFRGATRYGVYPVAQHCAIVADELARVAGPQGGLFGLLHHAAAAYTDKPSPALQAAIHEAFGLPRIMPEAIRSALVRIHDSVELTELTQLCLGCEPEITELEQRGAVLLTRPRSERDHNRRENVVIKPRGWDWAHERFVEVVKTHTRIAGLHGSAALEGMR